LIEYTERISSEKYSSRINLALFHRSLEELILFKGVGGRRPSKTSVLIRPASKKNDGLRERLEISKSSSKSRRSKA